MKIAVFLSGFLRIHKETYNNHFHHFFSKFDCDFYIHTWNKLDCGVMLDDFEGSIKSLYNPKELVIEDYFEFDTTKYTNHYGRCNNVLSMFYKIRKGFELIPTHKYDLIVRMRTDHFFLEGPNQHTLNLAKMSKKVVFPKSNINKGVNDQFAIAVPETMDAYSRVYENIDKYYDEGLQINPELILSHHVKKHNIKTVISNVSFCDYTYNSSFVSTGAYLDDVKKRHPGVII